MSYVVGNDGVIKDPYVVEELGRIQAAINGLYARLGEVETLAEKPDEPIPTTKGDPVNPDRTTPPPTIGVRWLTGPWVLGQDGAGLPKNVPSYAICAPPALTADTHNFSPSGIDSAILLSIDSTIATVNLTGIRIATPAVRLLAVYNRSGGTLQLVNQSASSEAKYRFSWGTTGDADETLNIPSGGLVWLAYNPSAQRWGLFAIPAVGADNVPPSLQPEGNDDGGYSESVDWFSARMTNTGSGSVEGAGEPTPVIGSNVAAAAADRYGYRQQCTTTAATGNTQGVTASAAGNSPRARLEFDNLEWTTLIKTGSDITNVQYAIVLSSAVPSKANFDAGTTYYVGFLFIPANSASWYGVSSNLGANVTGSAAMDTVVANTVYKLKMRWDSAAQTLYFSTNDGTEVSISTNIPLVTTDLQWYAYVETRENVAKTLHWYRHAMKLGGIPA